MNYCSRISSSLSDIGSSFLSRAKKHALPLYEKVSFVAGYSFMKASQYFCRRPKLILPKIVEEKIAFSSERELDQLLGFATENEIVPIKEPIYDTAEPIRNGFDAAPKADRKWALEEQISPEIFNVEFSDFRNFLFLSKIYRQCRYYQQPIYFDSEHHDFFLMVNGRYCSSREILKEYHLENRDVRERGVLPPFIVHNCSGRRCAYLQNGLVFHDSESDFEPYKVLTLGKRNSSPQLHIKFALNGHFDSPKGVAELDYHSWGNLEKPSGEVYSFGLFAQGIVQSPDPFEYSRRKTKTVTFTILRDALEDIYRFVKKAMNHKDGSFHLSKNNCVVFMQKICGKIYIDIRNTDLVSNYDHLANRIRIFAVAKLIAQFLKTPDVSNKLIAIQELVNAKEHYDHLPQICKELIRQFFMDQALGSISAKMLAKKNPEYIALLKMLYRGVKAISEKMDANALEKMRIDLPISPMEIRDLCKSIQESSERTLTYKIYELFHGIVTHHSSYQFNNPATFYEVLKQLPGQEGGLLAGIEMCNA